MSKKSYIKIAIKKFVRENSFLFSVYSNWYVGISGSPATRKVQHGNPDIWRSWKANSVKDARDIEKYFLDEGMDGDTGGGTNPNYVYVYKL